MNLFINTTAAVNEVVIAIDYTFMESHCSLCPHLQRKGETCIGDTVAPDVALEQAGKNNTAIGLVGALGRVDVMTFLRTSKTVSLETPYLPSSFSLPSPSSFPPFS